MITKQTVIDQIQINRDATIQIRFALLIMEDGNELSRKFHRTSIAPDGDALTQLDAVNADLKRRGGEEVDVADVARLTAIAPVVQTDDAKSKYTEMVVAQARALVLEVTPSAQALPKNIK